MSQRVVVVGATGQIGRPLCRELMRAGHAVVVFSRDPDRARQLVPGAAGYGYPVLDAALHDLLGRPDRAPAAAR